MTVSRNMLLRHHLLDNLDPDNLARLIIIYADPGAGKTQLARQLPGALGLPAVWQSLNRWQRDLPTLHRQCIYAWREQFPEIMTDLTQHVTEPHDAAEHLTQYLLEHLHQPCLYIIDDVQHLNNIQQATQWLQLLLERLPQDVHLVIVGQVLPELSWVSLVSQGLVTVIDAERLRFTPEEVMQLRPDVTRAQATALVEQYNGWAAGIRLALEQGALPTAEDHTGQPQAAVFNTLAINVLRQQSAPLQDFLLATSVPLAFNPLQASALLDIQLAEAQALIQGLLDNRLFLEQHNDAYTYHDSFRAALQRHLKGTRPEQYRHWHHQMGLLVEERDEIENAVYHFIEADDMVRAARLAQEVASEFHSSGRWQTLLTFQEMLLDHDVPRLNLLAGLALCELGRFDESDTVLEKARESFARRGDAPNMLRVRIQLCYNLHRTGANSKALAAISAVLNDTGVANSRDLQGWALRVRSNILRDLGRFQAAEADIKSSMETLNQRYGNALLAQLQHDLCEICLLSGRFEAADEHIRTAVNMAKRNKNMQNLAYALNNRGYRYHLNGHYEGAARAYEEGLAPFQAYSNRGAGYLSWSLGDLQRDLGHYDRAYAHYVQALDYARRADDRLYNLVCLSMARLRTWQGMSGDVQVWLKNIHTSADASVTFVAKRGVAVGLLHNAIENGLTTEALTDVQAILDDLQGMSAYIALAQLLGLYTYVGLQLERADILDDAHARIAALAPQFYQPIAADLVHLADGMRRFHSYFAQDLTTTFVELRRLMDDLDKQVQQRQQTRTSRKWHQLKLRTLGAEQVLHNDQLISVKRWQVPKPRELLFYLHVMGPRTKAEIGLAFFPEHSDKARDNAVKDTLKKLRAALAIDDAILLEDMESGLGKCYRINPDVQIDWDVDRFRNYLERAHDLPARDTRTEDLFRRALALYQGEFLPSVFSGWVENWRTTLQREYLEALLGMGICLLERKDPHSALGYFERAVAQDNLHEPSYQALMETQGLLCRAADVRRTYDALAAALYDDLKAQPSAESVRIMQAALAKAQRC